MRAGMLVLLVALAALFAAPHASADDPPLLNWPALLPSLAQGFTPNTFDICRDGSPRCLDHTLAELRTRINAHDLACSDNALFARNYRLVTDFYQRIAGTGFFQDDGYVAREDAIFAQLYFDAEDAWARGERDKVPEAWRIAFQAGDEKAVQGAGNLLLGINAHVQRDQPYMIAGLGLVDESGRSRKADHDKFNELLNTAYDDVFAQAIEWDDPDLAFYEVPGTQADNLLAFQTIAGWRENVWRNAERLVGARSDEERRLVAESIEANAAQWAQRIRDSFRYGGPFTRANREALCAKRAQRAAADERALAAAQRERGGRAQQPGGDATGGCRIRPRIGLRGRRATVGPQCLKRLHVAIADPVGEGRCRFASRAGRLGAPRSCSRPKWLAVAIPFRSGPLPPGRRYVVAVRNGPRRTLRVVR